MKTHLQFVDIPGRSKPQSVSVTPTGRVNLSNYGHLLTPDKAEEYGVALIRAAAVARTVEFTPRRSPFGRRPSHSAMKDNLVERNS